MPCRPHLCHGISFVKVGLKVCHPRSEAASRAYKGWKKERSSHQPALVPSVHSHQHSKVHIQALNFDVMEPKRIRGGLSTSPSRAQYHTLAGSVHRHGAVSRQFKLETPADIGFRWKFDGLPSLSRAGLSSHLEVGSGWGQDCSRTRSADILVTNWDKGISAAFNVTVTSPLNSSVVTEAGMYSGVAARAAEFRKHSENDTKCAPLSWKCLGEDMLMARWDDSLENISWAPFPQLPYVSIATRMQVHPNSRHFGPLESCLRASAATAAAPAIRLDSPKMAGVRDDVTVISSAAGLPLSHPAMRISAGRQRSATASLRRLCRMTTSPPCLQLPQEVVSYDHISSMSAGPSGGCVVPQEVVSYDHISSMSLRRLCRMTTSPPCLQLPQEVVSYDHISSMSAGHCMVAKEIEGAHDPT
ncbi:hypothetical protein EMCRGX_G034244 [Ephydatia muelleri]